MHISTRVSTLLTIIAININSTIVVVANSAYHFHLQNDQYRHRLEYMGYGIHKAYYNKQQV